MVRLPGSRPIFWPRRPCRHGELRLHAAGEVREGARGRHPAVSRDWDGLRALLADDVKLHQSLHPLRVGRADVGLFFTLYAKIDDVLLAPGWLEGREVIAVFEDRANPKPSYIMWLEWRDGQITYIHDYRYWL
jgi:hypothetical protein